MAKVTIRTTVAFDPASAARPEAISIGVIHPAENGHFISAPPLVTKYDGSYVSEQM
jgi:hypothetical protein